MDSDTPIQAYRLEGEVDGDPLRFYLALGEHRVGSAADSDVHLPFSGVSRQHALLIATPRSLIVEDRGSTNGTSIDGEAIDRAPVPPGVPLCFGPICLTPEPLANAGSRLAIRLDLTPPPAAEPPERPTTLFQHQPEDGETLPAVERLLDRCPWSGPREAIGEVIHALMDELPLVGAQALHWTPGEEFVVLGSRGRGGILPSLDALEASGRQPPGQRSLEAMPLGPEDGLTGWWTAAVTAGDVHGLAVWWPEADVGAGDRVGASHGLLRTAVRMVERCATSSDPRQTVGVKGLPGELVFPPEICRCPSPAMRALEADILSVASSGLPILIHGETGVGKDVIARIVHANSGRGEGPWVAVNCAALPTELLEAELFGIGRGVATGVSPRQGLFARAEGGTLFLDEIGELPLELQAKLLRALQEKEIQPVGGEPRAVDVRVLAATNVELVRLGDGGSLRQDLFFRLAGCLLEIPPLRRRRSDISLLVEHGLRRLAAAEGVYVHGVTAGALERLEAHGWPGNVRELEHEVARAARVAAGRSGRAVIDEECLSLHPSAVETPGTEPAALQSWVAELETLEWRVAVDRFEKALVEEALKRAEGRKLRAARLLGVSRSGLEGRLKRLGIPWSQSDPTP